MTPLRTETLHPSRVRYRIAQLGGQFMPGRSNQVRHIYYIRRTREWLAVSAQRDGSFRLAYYSECPCGATR